MALGFQLEPRCGCFLRPHVHALLEEGELRKDLLGVDEKPDESRGAALARFFYPNPEAAGPYYVEFPFVDDRANQRLLSDVLADRDAHRRPILLVSGSTGSGKTTACARAFTDINQGHAPFDRPARDHTVPRVAAWVRCYDFLYAPHPESAFASELGGTTELLDYGPSVAFFLDFDRVTPQNGETSEEARRRLAQFVLRRVHTSANRATARPAHIWVLMLRTQTEALPDERIPLDLLDLSERWSPLPLADAQLEHRRLAYLAAVLAVRCKSRLTA